jgi:hypothetical protein
VTDNHGRSRSCTPSAAPLALIVDRLTEEELLRAFDYCLTDEARVEARRAAGTPWDVERVRDEFVAALAGTRVPTDKRTKTHD